MTILIKKLIFMLKYLMMPILEYPNTLIFFNETTCNCIFILKIQNNNIFKNINY